VNRVLQWIGFRDLLRLDDHHFRAMFGAKTLSPTLLRDFNPRGTLLRALQDGSLSAIRDGAELPCEAWASVTERTWPDDVRFRREDVLKRWPGEIRGTGAEEELASPSRVSLKGKERDQAIRDALREAIKQQTALGSKNLNGKEQVKAAMKILRRKGVEGPFGVHVQDIADAEYKKYRNPVGVTLKSQRPKER
jgi:hypothetical protein